MRDSKLKWVLVNIYEKLYDWRRTVIREGKYALSVRHDRLRIMSPERTIKYIQKTNCSIARFGDGEFDLLYQKRDLNFQVTSDALSGALREVLDSNNPNLLLCVPGVFNSIRGTNYHAAMFWSHWAIQENRRHSIVELIHSCGKSNYLFGDAQITRPYIDWASTKRARKIFPQLKQLWYGKDILIVEGEKTRLGVGNDLFSDVKSIKRILCPAVNAFTFCEDIFRTVLHFHQNELIVLALGPTATVLAAKLSECGLQALDLGHVDIEYEWFLSGAKEKQLIPGKYINEIPSGREPEECTDNGYLREIIASICNDATDDNRSIEESHE